MILSSISKTIFIADVHLCRTQPHIIALFLQLLAQCDPSWDALYILGDLFDYWIGDDDPTYSEIVHALKKVTTQGVAIYLLHGNRDFLINSCFLKQTGCILLPDAAKIHVYGTPVLLMHGDRLCSRDISYQFLRKAIRCNIIKYLFLRLPLTIRHKWAFYLRRASRWHTRIKASYRIEAMQEAVLHYLSRYAVTILIHGHTHQPDIHKFMFNQTRMTRFVLGAWDQQAESVIWTADGKKYLLPMTQICEKQGLKS